MKGDVKKTREDFNGDHDKCVLVRSKTRVESYENGIDRHRGIWCMMPKYVSEKPLQLSKE